jgi:calcineurin-like phosphoesterase family protein
MDTYFTSDTHFGHKSVIDFCKRPFRDVEEMNAALVENWNSVVKRDDRVYHLGDFAWDMATAKEIRPQLNGHIRLVIGNHDDVPKLAATGMFTRMSLWRAFKDWNFTATHIPLALSETREGAFNVHGHKHNDPNFDRQEHQINVCTEMTNYTPIHVEEITFKTLI